jgi:hypothetical protein
MKTSLRRLYTGWHQLFSDFFLIKSHLVCFCFQMYAAAFIVFNPSMVSDQINQSLSRSGRGSGCYLIARSCKVNCLHSCGGGNSLSFRVDDVLNVSSSLTKHVMRFCFKQSNNKVAWTCHESVFGYGKLERSSHTGYDKIGIRRSITRVELSYWKSTT